MLTTNSLFIIATTLQPLNTLKAMLGTHKTQPSYNNVTPGANPGRVLAIHLHNASNM